MKPQLVLEEPSGPLDRQLFSLRVESPGEVHGALQALESKRFVLFLAWDAHNASDETVLQLARALVAEGLAYLVAWGPDCERVHDLFDRIDMEENVEADTVIMTTWHSNEPLEEALWFALSSAWPAPPYDQGCAATVAVAIANNAWGDAIHGYLGDLKSLTQAVGG
ncbi:MAG TPA: hypothetical protein VGS07_08595 [Thermoanaerobaculia bacterium]|jgi:hypothetical protein|nr:hypothetical protein [Thermoanaerobaculia bacterium]